MKLPQWCINHMIQKISNHMKHTVMNIFIKQQLVSTPSLGHLKTHRN